MREWMKWNPDSWSKVFHLERPMLELIARGAILYASILVLLRIMPRRSGGELAMMDLIFALLITEAAAHALGEYHSITEGLIVILTIMGCNFLVNVLSYKIPYFE